MGTVQWGLNYGVANRSGVTAPKTAAAILASARTHGLEVLDTASLYGDAESVLGANPLHAFRVVTKTPRFATPSISSGQSCELVRVFRESLQRLGRERIYGLLIHHADDLLAPGGNALVATMSDLKASGTVEKIGVSVYEGAQVDRVLKVFLPDIVQLPLNVLDQRMLLDGRMERLKQAGVEIHVRSVFLQGLLLMPPDRIPPYFNPIRSLLANWRASAEDQGMTPGRAALAFVRDIASVDTVLVGVENLDQLQTCMDDFSAETRFDASELACEDPHMVNPALWKL